MSHYDASLSVKADRLREPAATSRKHSFPRCRNNMSSSGWSCGGGDAGSGLFALASPARVNLPAPFENGSVPHLFGYLSSIGGLLFDLLGFFFPYCVVPALGLALLLQNMERDQYILVFQCNFQYIGVFFFSQTENSPTFPQSCVPSTPSLTRANDLRGRFSAKGQSRRIMFVLSHESF